ncbi:heat shock protein HspQ [Henriciella aquimarina]|uniref:heat shock protein HspQ n=1 Tax=Henriciella aquimarina TaxID=545261 RepID=UPI000A046A22|nr:heat shock protein HspQ [Henriciella aquimarina]
MGHGLGIGKRIAALFRRKKGETAEQKAAETVAVSPAAYEQDDTHFLYNAIDKRQGKFQIGQVVQHRIYDFRGVIFDVDPIFSNTDEWYDAIPEEMRPSKDQPYYHLFAENDKTHYVAYVSEGNLVPDESDAPVTHPDIPHFFERTPDGYTLKRAHTH